MQTSDLKSAEVVQDANRKMYHIGVGPSDIAPIILLCGDVGRPARVAERFDTIRYQGENREFRTFTGLFKGTPITAMSSGIGPSCVEIVMTELAQIAEHPLIIRIGTCGGFQDFINNGDLVISTAAYRMEDSSLKMVEPGYPANAHHKVIGALENAATDLACAHHVGLTATSSGFFAGQGRNVAGFQSREPSFVEKLQRLNIYNCEMESSTLFTMANLKGWMAGTVCAVVANRVQNKFIAPDEYKSAESRAIEVALRAAHQLWEKRAASA